MNIEKLTCLESLRTRKELASTSIPGDLASPAPAKKILILCHDFPPLNSVGALRPYNWFRTARQAGFYPVVVGMEADGAPASSRQPGQKEPCEGAVEDSAGLIIRAQRRVPASGLLRKAKSVLNRFSEHYTTLFDSKWGIYEQAAAYLEKNEVSAIVACGEPFILFRYAYLLSRRFNVPCVLDFRDEWTPQNLKSPLQRATASWNLPFQRKYLDSALFYSSVSDGLVERIRERTGCLTPGLTVANGVDLDLLGQTPRPVRDPKDFRLVYTGVVYDERYIEIFRAGLERFLAEVRPKDFHVEFYGIDYYPNAGYRQLSALAAEHPDVVSIQSRVTPRQALELQAGATVLLSLLPGSQAQGIMGTKTYEYLASGRPTIVVPSFPDRRTHLFPDTRYQIFALDAEELARELKSLYKAHEAGNDLGTAITEAEIASISRQRSSARLFGAIDQALSALTAASAQRPPAAASTVDGRFARDRRRSPQGREQAAKAPNPVQLKVSA